MIHQFVPMLHLGDAVGRHTMSVRDALVARGVASEIFVEIDDPETAGLTRPVAEYAGMAGPGDVLVYQFATASEVADQLAARPETLVVNYHNITPPACFAPWDNALARHQEWGLVQLDLLARRSTLGVAVSEVNRVDLVAAGFARTAVVPPVVGIGASEDVVRPARSKGARWLAVGRLAPNKAVQDVVEALFAYRLCHDADAELVVVGRPMLPAYTEALHRHVADLGLVDAVHFAGRVTDEELDQAYRAADVLVVASEHEGFCLPAVEALRFGLPVVAYRQGALPEVLGDGGILVDRKDPQTVADAVRRVLTDVECRARLAVAGRARLAALRLDDAGERLADLLTAVGDGSPLPESAAVKGHLTRDDARGDAE